MLNREFTIKSSTVRSVVDRYTSLILLIIDCDSGPDVAVIKTSRELELTFGFNGAEPQTYTLARMLLGLGYGLFAVRASKCDNRISARISPGNVITYPEYYEDEYANPGIRNTQILPGRSVSAKLAFEVYSEVSDTEGEIVDFNVLADPLTDYIIFNTNEVYWTGIMFHKDGAISFDKYPISRSLLYKLSSLKVTEDIVDDKTYTYVSLDKILSRITLFSGYTVTGVEDKEVDGKKYKIVTATNSMNTGGIQSSFRLLFDKISNNNEIQRQELYELSQQSHLVSGSRLLDVFSIYDSGVENSISMSIEKNYYPYYNLTLKLYSGNTVKKSEEYIVTMDFERDDYIENVSSTSEIALIRYFGDKKVVFNPDLDTYELVDVYGDERELYPDFPTGEIFLKRKFICRRRYVEDYINSINNLDISSELLDIITDSGVSDADLHLAILNKFKNKTYSTKLFRWNPADVLIDRSQLAGISFFNGMLYSSALNLSVPAWYALLVVKSLGYNEYQFSRDLFNIQYRYISDIPDGYVGSNAGLIYGQYYIDGELVQLRDPNNNDNIINVICTTDDNGDRVEHYDHKDIPAVKVVEEEKQLKIVDTTVDIRDRSWWICTNDQEISSNYVFIDNNWKPTGQSDNLEINMLEQDLDCVSMIKVLNPMAYLNRETVVPVGMYIPIIIMVNYSINYAIRHNGNVPSTILSLAKKELGSILSSCPPMSIESTVDGDTATLNFDVSLKYSMGKYFNISFEIVLNISN